MPPPDTHVPAAVEDATEPPGSGDADPRQRLLEGLADVIREQGGFRGSTVAGIVASARTSRRTFYEHFSSREDCFLAMLAEVTTLVVAHIEASVDREAPWRDQVRQAIDAWLQSAAAEPAITRSWARDAPALGAAADQLQHRSQQAFVDLVLDLARSAAAGDPALSRLSPQMAIVLVGGLRELIALQVERGAPIEDLSEVAVAATTAMLLAG